MARKGKLVVVSSVTFRLPFVRFKVRRFLQMHLSVPYQKPRDWPKTKAVGRWSVVSGAKHAACHRASTPWPSPAHYRRRDSRDVL